MSIEFFTEEGRCFAPMASIRKQGQIGFNKGAVNRYKLKDGQYVILGYDKAENLIAVKFADAEEKGAKRLTVKNGNASISAKGFFDFFGIEYEDKTRKYNLSEENNCLVFRIGETNRSEFT